MQSTGSAVWSVVKGILSGTSLKTFGYIAAGIAVLFVCYRGVSLVRAAEADHAAVAVLTQQRDEAVKTANSNAAALIDARAQHEAVLMSAQAAAADARTRAETLAADLETLRHASHTSCTPSDTDRRLLERLR